MTLRNRRILYLVFIIIFFLVAPPLVLYTAGFRYDFEYNRIVETGSLVVKSYPEDADIYINEEKYSETSPTIINTILPGKINLLVSKTGCHDWVKTIEIKPRVTAFEENIKLYAKAEPISIIQDNITKYWFNEKQDKFAYLTEDNKLRIFNTLNKKDTLIANLDKKSLHNFQWSLHDDQFVFGRKDKTSIEYFIIDANFLERVIPLSSVTTLNLENVQWDPVDKNSLYALSNENLYRIPYLLKTTRLIASGEIRKYLIQEKRIILIQELEKNKYTLSWIEPQDQNTIHVLPFVDVSKNHIITNTNSHRIALYNQNVNSLTIIDPSIKNPLLEDAVITILNVDKFYWARDGQKLIYTDKFGIYTQSFNTPITVVPIQKYNELIIKYSYPIKEIVLSDDENHIFYTVGNSLRVAELVSSSEPRITILLDDLDQAYELKLVRNQEYLTFIGSASQLNGLILSLENARPFFAGDK
ncbi:PEGA domain-containing protein [Patescibacteria group bacterium]|nr:PEGA domain-containing protein [Patescibacteria group bacterium]